MAAPTYQIKFEIREDSKYHDQAPPGTRFTVYRWDHTDKYCIIGGPGERYRLRDVDLYVCTPGEDPLCIARGERKEVVQ